MKKTGFTLIELLLVIVIMAVISLSTTLMFKESNDTTNDEELVNTYVDIQRVAMLYIDLNESWTMSLNENGVVNISISELQSTNYLSRTLVNPVTGEEIDPSSVVEVYITTETNGEYVSSCIKSSSGGCLSNSEGSSNSCCEE